MNENTTGKCHCGKVQYSITGEQMHASLCHCSDCSHLHGGSRATLAIYGKDAITVEAGELRKYVYDGGKGKIHLHFCGDCSTPLYGYPEAYPVVAVRANSLDNKEEVFTPVESLFTEHLPEWDLKIKK